MPNLCTILITTKSSPHLLHRSGIPFLHFPPYTREETLHILSQSSYPLGSLSSTAKTSTGDPPKWTYSDEDTKWLWSRYVGHVWDALGQGAARDLITFRDLCEKLWQPFIQPVIDGQYGVRKSQELSKLLVRNRALLQSEASLLNSIVPTNPTATKPGGTIGKGPFSLPVAQTTSD